MVDKGYAVFAYDMLGFGNGIEEGTRFYNRYPQWSKMGKMVADTKSAVDAMVNLDFIDGDKVFLAGYSLGATVGLFTIKAYSHLHGLLPRLGFFVGHEERIPFDFHEILASIAPRPLLVIAPVLNKDVHLRDVQLSVEQAGKIYSLYGSSKNIKFYSPDDYSRFSPGMRKKMYDWFQKMLHK